ncbi:MAG TPA: beta-glucosidase BglX [Terriglobia bacterium]|nr:beta-glucosidase BglX [Terriglobia bacterium]
MIMNKWFPTLLALVAFATVLQHPNSRVKASPLELSPAEAQLDRQVNELLARMTTEEKIGQLTVLRVDPATSEMIRKGEVGSIFGVTNPAEIARLQHIAVTESRLHIPILFGFDVIHGYRTIFPIPLAMAGSFDPKLEEGEAAIAAAEASAAGQRWTFAPMIDIARDPRWGRITEGAGEDPVLAAAMAAAQVRGFQGDNLADPRHLLACAKHFAAYGAAEGGRDYNTADMSMQRLRNVYLPPFHAAVTAGAQSVMTAFNALNGVPGVENSFLLQQVLRKEWGFRGLVASDYDAVNELITHGVATDSRQAVREALSAGTDMDMHDGLYLKELPALLAEGHIPPALLNKAVRRVLRVKIELGLFDHPYTAADASSAKTHWLTPAARAAAKAAEERSAVLLHNSGNLLPLDESLKTVAVIGPLADSHKEPLSSWHGDGDPKDTVTILDGLKQQLPNARFLVEKGVAVRGDSEQESEAGIARAVAAARQAQVAILTLGETADMSGEAASRSCLNLPGHQEQLLEAVVNTGTPVVLLLMNGHPLTISWAANRVPAILELWEGGTEVGNAAADLLFGKANPGGKLAVSIPRTVGQIPVYYDHLNTGRPGTLKTHNNSRYLDLPLGPLYRFGYGLSYTTFRFSQLTLSSPEIKRKGRMEVSVTISNTGHRVGDEVAQLYIRQRVASLSQPVRELKGFERITLPPGRSRPVRFTLSARQLGFWDNEGRFRIEPGTFDLWVGDSSAGGLHTSFLVK